MRSTAGQHLRHNKAAAVECWQQEVDNKKTLFWILRRAVTQGRYLVPFSCQEFPKHLHWWDTLLEQQLQRGGCPWLPEMALMSIFWPTNLTQGLGSDGNSICSPNSPISTDTANTVPKEFPMSRESSSRDIRGSLVNQALLHPWRQRNKPSWQVGISSLSSPSW